MSELKPCRCWIHNHAIGHEGHCCFLIDDRGGKRMTEVWRADDDVCHTPPIAQTPEEMP